MNHLKEKARNDGYVETLFGRRRPSPDIHSSNFIVRQAAERAAINMPIQGTEADLMKMAMVEVQQKLDQSNESRVMSNEKAAAAQNSLLTAHNSSSMQLLQIHDSIMVECPEDQAESIAQMLKDTMEK